MFDSINRRSFLVGMGGIIGSAFTHISGFSRLRKFSGNEHGDVSNPMKQILDEILEEAHINSIEKRYSNAVQSGLHALDNRIIGFLPGELIVVAGEPGMGKTSLAITIARNAALKNQHAIGIFSPNTANHVLELRLLCSEARVAPHLLNTGILPKCLLESVKNIASTLSNAPIYFNETSAMELYKLKTEARRMKADHNIKMIIIDDMQFLQSSEWFDTRQEEVSTILNTLKKLAVELKIPIMAFSDLPNRLEKQNNKQPDIWALRDCNINVSVPDKVLLLYRHFVYSHKDEDREKAEIIVAKNRYGATGTAEVVFVERFGRFENMPEPEFQLQL
ncbi:MAG: DnaB-like helicase C-terminal domain-containing protein [Candidatus Marinimicrobia bacterium]|nr:DnaB-like helicase C-terminal domain-containing protein [Candidatus Neomarinimicrobiota bacterium]